MRKPICEKEPISHRVPLSVPIELVDSLRFHIMIESEESCV